MGQHSTKLRIIESHHGAKRIHQHKYKRMYIDLEDMSKETRKYNERLAKKLEKEGF